MILTCENRILTLNGNPIIRKSNVLTFNVEGSKFPNFSFTTTSNGFWFISSINQKVIVNWGDGNSETIQMRPISGRFGVGWTQSGAPSTYVPAGILEPVHTYTDGNSSSRVISFMFEDITKLYSFNSFYILLNGAFPVDLLRADKLNTLAITSPKNMTTLPNLSQNRDLKELTIAEYSETLIPKIPDSFFETNLRVFKGARSFNLSDKISSNLFKLNQWTDLEILDLEGCNIVTLDSTFSECVKLTDLRLGGANLFTSFPTEVEKFVNLAIFYIKISGANISLLDFSLNNKLASIYFVGDFNLIEIPSKWQGLVSLKTILTFNSFCSAAKFNQFIDVFYELCTTNGSIAVNGSPQPYPNRFRNISWGHGTYSFTGSKVAPAGYVQGVSNGSPINQGQKAYVLQNQYNHVITHA